ncbi:nibrin-like [Ornithodoros turicata]|uniref:nibrin-like n=1 Tax=Ornithodoros turicata TaxID=34597 RepID=UPI00313862AC
MWSLWNHREGGVFHKLLCNTEYQVGRKDTAIVIKDDQSVSRQHAVLLTSAVLSDKVEDIAVKPLLRVKDLGSKYGTWVNNTRLQKDEERMLQNGDEIKFGQLSSSYEVRYEEPLVVTSSCLRPDRKKLLKDNLAKLGGRLLQEWTPRCTHLVMDSVTLTIKTASALLAVKPIVTPAFIEDTVKRIQEGVWEPLNPSNYIPNIDEHMLRTEKQSFDRNPARQTLFSGKVFYFLDKVQYKKLHIALASGGAKVILDEGEGEPKDVYTDCSACVMRPPEGHDHPVTQFLAKKGLRVIPESDVGLAVAYCSTEKFCNPRSTAASNFWRNTTLDTQSFTQGFTQGDVYVAETELSEMPGATASRSSNITTRTIPESKPSTSTAAVSDITGGSTVGTTMKQSFFVTPNANEASPNKSTPSTAQSLMSPSKRNGRSPSKIRKKDAVGTIPLQFYFPKKRQNDDSRVDCPAEKVARLILDDEGDDDVMDKPETRPPPAEVEMAEVKQEPVLAEANHAYESKPARVEIPQTVLPEDFHVEVLEPMVCKQRSVVPLQTADGPNFKRFRKAHQINVTGLPQFIRTTTVTAPMSWRPSGEDEDDGVCFGEPPQTKRRRQ